MMAPQKAADYSRFAATHSVDVRLTFGWCCGAEDAKWSLQYVSESVGAYRLPRLLAIAHDAIIPQSSERRGSFGEVTTPRRPTQTLGDPRATSVPQGAVNGGQQRSLAVIESADQNRWNVLTCSASSVS